jgi:hypothetical protein
MNLLRNASFPLSSLSSRRGCTSGSGRVGGSCPKDGRRQHEAADVVAVVMVFVNVVLL